jgi:hypothetical protein
LNTYQVTGTFAFQTQATDTPQVRETLHRVLSQEGWSDKNFDLKVELVGSAPISPSPSPKTGAAPTIPIKGKATRKSKVKEEVKISDEELLKQLKEQLKSQAS